jgi:hypothetical protein
MTIFKRLSPLTLVLSLLFAAIPARATETAIRIFELRDAQGLRDGLPSTLVVYSVEVYRDGVFEPLMALVSYESSDAGARTVRVPLQSLGRVEGGYVAGVMLESRGLMGSSCGPHDMRRLTLEFVLDRAGKNLREFRVLGRAEETPDNCHTPLETRDYDYVERASDENL